MDWDGRNLAHDVQGASFLGDKIRQTARIAAPLTGHERPPRAKQNACSLILACDANVHGHRRCRLPRLASLRRAARPRKPGDLRRQPRDRLARQHRAHSRSRELSQRQRGHHRAVRDRRACRLRLPPGIARLPDRLPASAAAHAEGRLLRHPSHARSGQGQARALSDRLHQRGVRRSQGTSAGGDLLGTRQPDRPARRLRRGQALCRGADDGLPPPAGVDTAIVRIFNTYGARMRPHDGRAIPPSCARRLPTGRSPSSATARRRAPSASSAT